MARCSWFPAMLPALPLMLISFIFPSCAAGAGAGAAASDEVGALLAFKRALIIPRTGATAAFFATWEAAASSPCNFTGVTCDPAGGRGVVVTGVSVEHLQISAASVPFDDMCEGLPALATLSLEGNYGLMGDISGVVTCTELQDLNLAHNNFDGAVPDLSPLTKLRALDISSNFFYRAFPWASLAAMPGLTVLKLGGNWLFGPTHSFLEKATKLTNLTVLSLPAMGLNSNIPSNIGDLVNLEVLDLCANNLSGQIPPEITRLTKLQELHLCANSLCGHLPAGFSRLAKLKHFNAYQNNLTGSLSELRSLTELVSLTLSQNNFSGELPQNLGSRRSKLYSIDVSENTLSGSIPRDMCEQGVLAHLSMDQNNFSGKIPTTYASCKTLLSFDVSKNSLSGDVPEGLWALPKVTELDLSDNQFTGGIGSGIANAASLNRLVLARNRFSGVIPLSIGNATQLEEVDLSSNGFFGEIPESIGNLARLSQLKLGGNRISVDIP